MKKIWKWSGIALICLLIVLCFHAASLSQTTNPTLPKKTLELSEKVALRLKTEKVATNLKEVTFQEAIKELSRQCKIGFIADDIPSSDRFTIKYVGTIKSLLDKFADFYDYSWKVGGEGEIQMMKQFSALHDYPQANMPELMQTAKEMQDVFSSIGSYPGAQNRLHPVAKTLYASFTQEQLAYLKAGNGIKATDFSQEQFAMVRRLAVGFIASEDQEGIDVFEYRLDHFSQSKFYCEVGKYYDTLYALIGTDSTDFGIGRLVAWSRKK